MIDLSDGLATDAGTWRTAAAWRWRCASTTSRSPRV